MRPLSCRSTTLIVLGAGCSSCYVCCIKWVPQSLAFCITYPVASYTALQDEAGKGQMPTHSATGTSTFSQQQGSSSMPAMCCPSLWPERGRHLEDLCASRKGVGQRSGISENEIQGMESFHSSTTTPSGRLRVSSKLQHTLMRGCER